MDSIAGIRDNETNHRTGVKTDQRVLLRDRKLKKRFPRRATPSTGRFEPAAPVKNIAGGMISLSPEIPVCLTENMITPGLRKAGSILLETDPKNPAFSRKISEYDAVSLIEEEFKKNILDIFKSRGEKKNFISYDATIYFCPREEAIHITFICNTLGVITPSWLSDDKIDDNTKAVVFRTLTNSVPSVLPCGQHEDMKYEYGQWHWFDETDEKKIIESMKESGEYDEENLPYMPKDLEQDLPSWFKIKETDATKLPPNLYKKIESIEIALKKYKKDKGRINFSSNFREDVLEVDPDFEDACGTPPLWLVPDTDITYEILNYICQYAMETRYDDLCGYIKITKAQDLKKLKKGLKTTIALLNAIEDLMNYDPSEILEHNKEKLS